MLLCRRLTLALMAAALTAPPLQAAPRGPAPQNGTPPSASVTRPGGAVALSLRRSNDSVDLVIEGTGAGPVLQQSRDGQAWQGQLRITSPGSLRMGPQRMSLPEAGLQSVSLQGSGSVYQIEVVPMPGAPLSRPVVSADGRNLIIKFAAPPQASSQTNRFNLREPGMVPQATYAPPLQPRAVAPPLGDMAVGTMTLRNQSFVNVSGPNVTLTLRNAPAKEALMAIAQLGGYGFVYVDEQASAGSQAGGVSAGSSVAGTGASRPVTIAFRGASYAQALNTILLSAGLQGKRDGNMIIAGPNALSKTFGPQLSKIYRLNQASAASAADYLASLGASITKINVITNSVTQGQPAANEIAGGASSQQTQTQKVTTTETYGGGVGPLKGLIGATDSRLQSITLIGDSALIAVAESYLRQLDLRQRQVALSIKILDVSLDNGVDINNSFAFRYGNNFIVNDEGRAVGAFNSLLPPGTVFDSNLPPPGFNAQALGANPAVNPGVAYGKNNFYDFIRASIESRTTKVLASPTLILSENSEEIGGSAQAASISADELGAGATIGRPKANESFVTVGEQVITSFTVQAGQNGAPNTCQPELGIAGLTFGARISRIDDNGFVTFSMSPQISASIRRQEIGGCGPIDILSVRRLDTGSARVRDGQTLVMTGVISDLDRSEVTKWPILGDIPLIGQFFRGSSNQRQKRELVILVTPRIIGDEQGGGYGYGYRPTTLESKRLLGGSTGSL